MDTVGQSQSPLHIPADGLETVLKLVITVVLLSATGVIAAIVLVTAFSHGGDAYVKLETAAVCVKSDLDMKQRFICRIQVLCDCSSRFNAINKT